MEVFFATRGTVATDWIVFGARLTVNPDVWLTAFLVFHPVPVPSFLASAEFAKSIPCKEQVWTVYFPRG